MIITLNQVAERLGVSSSVVNRLIREGSLVPVNERKEGAKKFFAKFDLKAVADYQKEVREQRRAATLDFTGLPAAGNNGHASAGPDVTTAGHTPASGIVMRLNVIERSIVQIGQKLDALMKVWS